MAMVMVDKGKAIALESIGNADNSGGCVEITGYHDLRGVDCAKRLLLAHQLRETFNVKLGDKLRLEKGRWKDLQVIWGESATNACGHASCNASDDEFVSYVVNVSNDQIVLKIVNSTGLKELTTAPVCDGIVEHGRGCLITEALKRGFPNSRIYREIIPYAEVNLYGFLNL